MKAKAQVQLRGLPMRRPTPSPFTSAGMSFETLVTTVEHLKKMHEDFSGGLKTVEKALAAFESIKEGKPGMPGVPGIAGQSVTPEMIRAEVSKLFRQPKDAVAPTTEEVANHVMDSGKFYKLVKKRLKDFKKDAPEEKMGTEQIVMVMREELSKRKLTIPDIEGLETTVAEIRNRSMRPYDPSPGNARGGGDTVVAGTGVTIVETINGTKRISVNASGISIKTPTGTVNAVNALFGVTGQPIFVIADGITYFEGAGYAYAALQITMDIPPSQYIRYAV